MAATPKKKTSKAPRAKHPASKTPAPSPLGPPPAGEDPKAHAQYFLELLDALGQTGTAEAMRIRHALIDAVAAFERTPDPALARENLLVHLAGIELGVSKLLLGATQKIRDRFVTESRRLGTKTPQARSVRLSAEAFEALCLGFSKMIEATEAQDLAGRDAAYRLLEEAGEKMKIAEAATR